MPASFSMVLAPAVVSVALSIRFAGFWMSRE